MAKRVRTMLVVLIQEVRRTTARGVTRRMVGRVDHRLAPGSTRTFALLERIASVGPRQFALCYPGIEIDVVESEDYVIDLARSFYGLDDIPRLTVHHAEGASFLEGATEGSWDIIVVDAYESDELGDGFYGRAFFRALRERLRPGGAFAFNVVGALDGSGAVRSVVRAAASVFDDVRLVPVMTTTETCDPSTVRNVVVVGVR